MELGTGVRLFKSHLKNVHADPKNCVFFETFQSFRETNGYNIHSAWGGTVYKFEGPACALLENYAVYNSGKE